MVISLTPWMASGKYKNKEISVSESEQCSGSEVRICGGGLNLRSSSGFGRLDTKVGNLIY